MHIYLSGIGGVGIGPLAEIANGAGFDVSGSDLSESLTTRELIASGIDAIIYSQDGSRMRELHSRTPIDWFVHTSALPDSHPELALARELGIRVSKRDEFLNYLLTERDLKLIAVSGTHGKTTTTGMIVWAMLQLGIPVSYSIGSTLSFGPAGLFDDASEYFVYECDEYDRNFLAFQPNVAIITTIDHDHFDTYPTLEAYTAAFAQFARQSQRVYAYGEVRPVLEEVSGVRYLKAADIRITITGEHNRRNASLALAALEQLLALSRDDLIEALNSFPGTNRRFEKLARNLYTDYGHHPVEIAASLQLASELNERVVLVYQPHQNSRQHEVRDDYRAGVFRYANKIYWLPTYLTREADSQPVLTPAELSRAVSDKTVLAELDDRLWQSIEQERNNGALVVLMGAGTIDSWVRERLDGPATADR